jgi:hypothetical protein
MIAQLVYSGRLQLCTLHCDAAGDSRGSTLHLQKRNAR